MTKTHLLLIEPDRMLAEIYRKNFAKSGYDVMMCASAQSAIFGADAVRPDLVILELQLIAHSGIEFLYEFRSYPEWQNIPAIILTNVPPIEFRDNWELMKSELGIAGYYYKPLTSLQTLLSSVNELVAQPTV
jgi:DNA-binding response OmpR family regulator